MTLRPAARRFFSFDCRMLFIAAGALWLCAKALFAKDFAAMAPLATAAKLHPFSCAASLLKRFDLAPMNGYLVARVQIGSLCCVWVAGARYHHDAR